MKQPFFSIGIIFKNEIRCLKRCLKSLQPLRDAVPCEVVMADTGSNDGSRQVAEQYADILFDFPWIDNFAAARNAVMDRCSGVWYFSIDADEWLDEDVQELTAFANTSKIPGDFVGITIRNYRSAALGKDQHYLDFVGVRMARLSTGIRYEGCIHEGWTPPGGGMLNVLPLERTILHHDGYVYEDKAIELAKRERNMALLKRKLAKNPLSLQTLMECIDSSKHADAIASADYARRAMEGVEQKWEAWEQLGPVVYRDAVSVARLHGLPEEDAWISKAVEKYPNSIFTRVDVSCYATAYYWDKKDYLQVIHYGEAYLAGLADYRAGRFPKNDLAHGVVENSTPFWEWKMRVILPEAYLNCGQPEQAFSALYQIKGEKLTDPQQVIQCTLALIRLHRTATLDTPALMADFWEQINKPMPDENMAQTRRDALLETAMPVFTARYHREEQGRDDFLRHGYTIFAALGDECELKTAAELLATEDSAFQEALLRRIEAWGEFPVQALAHALKCGAEFPLPEKPLTLETMDYLVQQLGQMTEVLPELFMQEAVKGIGETLQKLTWMRGMSIAAVRSFDWNGCEDLECGLELAKGFAVVEGAFLRRYYTQEMLQGENLPSLPRMHRLGWCFVQAFEALDAGDAVGYVRLLRAGLGSCEEMKAMVEFLQNHTPELNALKPTDELRMLAEQVRAVLSRFAPNDPMVTVLKQSEAYQKVAQFIDGVH